MTPSGPWRFAGACALAALVALMVLFRETAISIVGIWWRSETYTHGFIVAPITAYLVWRRRAALARITPRPSLLGLLSVLVFAGVWLLGESAGVLVVRQFAFVGVLVAAAWAILGTQVLRALLFPAGFLFFAVPAGEILIPFLTEFTGRFAVAALRVSGVPVSVEGNVLRLPNATWQVTEACSGIRYLMATLTLGTLYAYLTYRSPTRRVVFSVASVIAPIIANGFRAYLIVMLGYMSDMTLAVGLDHYLYGWVLFLILILGLFWAGTFWREPSEPARAAAPPPGATPVASRGLRLAAAAALAVAVAALGPIGAAALGVPDRPARGIALSPPAPAGGWKLDAAAAGTWHPDFAGAAAACSSSYRSRSGEEPVTVRILYYRHQVEGAELLSTQNAIVATTNRAWRRGAVRELATGLGNASFPIRETVAYSDRERVRIWDWYWVRGTRTSSLIQAKMAEAATRLTGRGDDGALVAIYTSERDGADAAAARLGGFVRDMLPSVDSSLGAALESGSAGAP